MTQKPMPTRTLCPSCLIHLPEVDQLEAECELLRQAARPNQGSSVAVQIATNALKEKK